MRWLIVVLGLMSCAAVGPATYEESSSCPVAMTDEMRESGAVRCRALCSSYARDFSSFDDDCKCRCRSPAGGGYRPKLRAAPKPFTDATF